MDGYPWLLCCCAALTTSGLNPSRRTVSLDSPVILSFRTVYAVLVYLACFSVLPTWLFFCSTNMLVFLFYQHGWCLGSQFRMTVMHIARAQLFTLGGWVGGVRGIEYYAFVLFSRF